MPQTRLSAGCRGMSLRMPQRYAYRHIARSCLPYQPIAHQVSVQASHAEHCCFHTNNHDNCALVKLGSMRAHARALTHARAFSTQLPLHGLLLGQLLCGLARCAGPRSPGCIGSGCGSGGGGGGGAWPIACACRSTHDGSIACACRRTHDGSIACACRSTHDGSIACACRSTHDGSIACACRSTHVGSIACACRSTHDGSIACACGSTHDGPGHA